MALARNFFDYFPVAPKLGSWGIYSTSFGTVHVPVGAPYPPPTEGHPGSRHFDWDQGRVLAEYQILYIRKGRGLFESRVTKPRTITDHTAFILFPGVWHRYRPDPGTGWTESWIEFKGPYVDRLKRDGVIDPRHPVYRTHSGVEIEQAFETAAGLARIKPPGFTVRLGLLAAEVLALLRWSSHPRHATLRRMDQVISESQALLAGDLEGKLSLEQIARQLGVGYSYFRRKFKAQTGLSPKQYRIEIRHHRVKNLLLNSNLTLKEIAEELGYSSPFHLSQEFSRITGTSPQLWRKRI
jgi:AraC-like DNA-binding protein